MSFEVIQLQFDVSEAAYTSGDMLDVVKTFNIGKATKAMLRSLSVLDYQDLAANNPTVNLHFFRSLPAGLAADNAAATLTDISNYLGAASQGTAAYLDAGSSKVMTCPPTFIGNQLILSPDKDGNIWVVATIMAASDFDAAVAGAGLDVILGLELIN